MWRIVPCKSIIIPEMSIMQYIVIPSTIISPQCWEMIVTSPLHKPYGYVTYQCKQRSLALGAILSKCPKADQVLPKASHIDESHNVQPYPVRYYYSLFSQDKIIISIEYSHFHCTNFYSRGKGRNSQENPAHRFIPYTYTDNIALLAVIENFGSLSSIILISGCKGVCKTANF